jgi:hypothetical protein
MFTMRAIRNYRSPNTRSAETGATLFGFSLCAIYVLSVLFCSGCTSQPLNPASPSQPAAASIADKAVAFAQSPAGQALANTFINVALDGATQYATSGKVDRHLLVANTLDGAAQNIRSLAGTPQASQPNPVYTAAADGIDVRSIAQQVAPLVAANVSRQIENRSVPPDQAIENLATTLNAASAKIRRANAGP